MHPRRKQELADILIKQAGDAAYSIDLAQSQLDHESYSARQLLANGLRAIEKACDASQELKNNQPPMIEHMVELEGSIARCMLLSRDDKRFLKGRILDAVFFGTGLQSSERSLLNVLVRDFNSIRRGE